VKLLVQPDSGVAPLVKGIDGASKSVEIVIFRFDRSDIVRALESAVKRGVAVHALIASASGGDRTPRKIETALLARGVTVARTSDDLVRYHGKMMIIDRRELYVCGFNFTHLDIDNSRSFGLATTNYPLVQEAVRLFEADTRRQPYVPGSDRFIVSPLNARKRLASFIADARKELLVYDLKVGDKAMVRLLVERAKAGVDIRIIGRVTRETARLTARKLPRLRLHTRTIVRDRAEVFLGSQSLRALELDGRREIGIIVRDPAVAKTVAEVFEQDWTAAAPREAQPVAAEITPPAARAARKIAKAVAKELPPMAPVVEQAVKRVVGNGADVALNHEQVEETVKDAVREAVKEAVRDVVEDAVQQKGPGGTV
jgi:phosphatidylserine/phosphatidylglycerophosphate/cardiolipin synthase-like enzyme